MTARVALLVLLIASPLVAAPAKPEPANPQEDLETAVPHGIKLLEGKKYADFLKLYAPPDFVKKLGDDGIKKFADEFGKEKAAPLLNALKEIKGTKPALADDGKKATFKLKTKIAGRDSMTWYKNGKDWYISN
jgi:hypothetical protein